MFSACVNIYLLLLVDDLKDFFKTYPVNIISQLKSVIAYMFQLVVRTTNWFQLNGQCNAGFSLITFAQ